MKNASPGSHESGSNLSTLSLELSILGSSIVMLLSKLLLVRLGRTGLLAETAQAIADDDPEAIDKSYGEMHSEATYVSQWEKLEKIGAEIKSLIEENMHLFRNADSALGKAGKAGLDLAALDFPEKRLAEIKAEADPENIYDKFEEYNTILNDYLNGLSTMANETSMALFPSISKQGGKMSILEIVRLSIAKTKNARVLKQLHPIAFNVLLTLCSIMSDIGNGGLKARIAERRCSG